MMKVESSNLDTLLVSAARAMRTARSLVCLTGAGVSAESGVATFRDAQSGLWARFDPQQLASQSGFAADPDLVWQWYMHRLDGVETAQPNAGHTALAQIEAQHARFTLITQNVDDLHERAGSQRVVHLHGQISRFHCNRCECEHTLTAAERQATAPPHCSRCGGPIRPGVVWFGESLPGDALSQAWREAEQCDVFLSVGTSGVVYPAAQLPHLAYRKGARVIEINPEETPLSEIAHWRLQGPSGEILPLLAKLMKSRDVE